MLLLLSYVCTSAQQEIDCLITEDSLSILASSVIITHYEDTLSAETYSIQDNKIIWTADHCEANTNKLLKVEYRTFPFLFSQAVQHLDTTAMKSKEYMLYMGYDYSPFTEKTPLISGKGLDYNGAFTRGFSVGNAQSLVLNSNFNLKMAGDLGNGLSIVAAISDDNIPIQPEGNTQVLQEFDQIYIRLSKDKTSVVAGDYQQSQLPNHFMQYAKKLKGASAKHQFALSENSTLDTRASFAIAKGKFNRYNLNTTEGNQGPYKLIGANGERFLIVLSGSERVYLDGSLLTRGESQDYTIDYNRAEITFTPNRIVTRESRIVVEYEYTDQNYLRTLYSTDARFESKKWTITTQLFSEQDSRNGSGQAQLDSIDRQILMNSGDDPLAAIRPGIFPIIDEADGITYEQIPNESTPDPTDTYLKYSQDSNKPLFRASFSEVGINRGDYRIAEGVGANGRVYEYVGEGMGNYMPIIIIIAPIQQQLLSNSIAYRMSDKTQLYSELAWSNNDLNRLSSIDDGDNQGLAGQIGIRHSIGKDSAGHHRIVINSQYDQIQKNFKAINPFRNPEFMRNWSLPNGLSSTQEKIWVNDISWKKDAIGLEYSHSMYDRDQQYNGQKHVAKLHVRNSKWDNVAEASYTTGSGQGTTSTFWKPKISLLRNLGKEKPWQIGYTYEHEKNEISSNNSLSLASFAFNEHAMTIRNDVASKTQFTLTGKYRQDDLPYQNELNHSINTTELSGKIKYDISKNNRIDWTVGVRDFDVILAEATNNLSSKQTILSRLASQLDPWNGVAKINLNYDISSGQEPKQEFVFEKVESGQGEYIFIGNDVSDETNQLYLYEYRPDIDTANYIKVFLYNNEFVRTQNQELKLSLRLNPRKIKTDKKKKQWWQKLSTLHTARVIKKVEDDNSENRFKVLDLSPTGENIAAYRAALNNTLFFNRSSTKFDIQIGNKYTENRITQIAGKERRYNKEYNLRSRWNATSGLDIIGLISLGQKSYDSQVFAIRNHKIDYRKIGPEVNWRPSNKLRIVTRYQYDDRSQQIGNNESAHSHDLTLESTYRSNQKLNFNLSLSWVNVAYKGMANTPIEYDLLEGLKNGNNLLWNVSLTRRMANNVDLNLQYNGRKTGIARTLHIARAQIKATF